VANLRYLPPAADSGGQFGIGGVVGVHRNRVRSWLVCVLEAARCDQTAGHPELHAAQLVRATANIGALPLLPGGTLSARALTGFAGPMRSQEFCCHPPGAGPFPNCLTEQ